MARKKKLMMVLVEDYLFERYMPAGGTFAVVKSVKDKYPHFGVLLLTACDSVTEADKEDIYEAVNEAAIEWLAASGYNSHYYLKRFLTAEEVVA